MGSIYYGSDTYRMGFGAKEKKGGESMIVLKDLMDDLEIGNRVMEEIERINTERKPIKISNTTNFPIWTTPLAQQPIVPQQFGSGTIDQLSSINFGGMTNGTI